MHTLTLNPSLVFAPELVAFTAPLLGGFFFGGGGPQ